MKRKIIALLLALAVMISLSLTVTAADTQALENARNKLKETVNIPTDIKIQRVDKGVYEESHIDTAFAANTAEFIYKASIDMQPVRDEFNAYLAYAEQLRAFGLTDADLYSVNVSGYFNVYVVFPEVIGNLIGDSIKNPTDDMHGFTFSAPEAASVYTEKNPDTGAIEREWTQDSTTKEYTLKIKVYPKSPSGGTLKAGDLAAIDDSNPLYAQYAPKSAAEYLADIQLEIQADEKLAVVMDASDTYAHETVYGYIDGQTDYYVTDGANTREIRSTSYKAVQFEGAEDTLVETKPSDEADTVKSNQISATYELRRTGIKKVEFSVNGTYLSGSAKDGKNYNGIIDPLYDENSIVVDVTGNNYNVPNVKNGYVFKGWSLTPNGEVISGEQEYTADLTTLYAVFERPKTGGGGSSSGRTTVSFVVDGEPNVVSSITGTLPVKVKLDEVNVPLKDGYVFDGWYLDEDMTEKADNDFSTSKAVTLYGKYVKYTAPDRLNTEKHMAYIIGYPEGDVRPENNISREEVATIIYRLLNEDYRNTILTTENDFPDVEPTRWSNRIISTMANGGYVRGYEDGTFRPGNYITRAEFVTIVSYFTDDPNKVAGSFSDIAGHWAEERIRIATANGWIAGYEDGSFRPNNYITRAEAITIINRLLDRHVNAEGLHADAIQWPDNLEGMWYYYDMLEATNPHNHERFADGVYEKWTEITDWFPLLV